MERRREKGGEGLQMEEGVEKRWRIGRCREEGTDLPYFSHVKKCTHIKLPEYVKVLRPSVHLSAARNHFTLAPSFIHCGGECT